MFEAMNIKEITQGECIEEKGNMVGEHPGRHCYLRNREKGTSTGNLQYINTSFYQRVEKTKRVSYTGSKQTSRNEMAQRKQEGEWKIGVLALAT